MLLKTSARWKTPKSNPNAMNKSWNKCSGLWTVSLKKYRALLDDMALQLISLNRAMMTIQHNFSQSMDSSECQNDPIMTHWTEFHNAWVPIKMFTMKILRTRREQKFSHNTLTRVSFRFGSQLANCKILRISELQIRTVEFKSFGSEVFAWNQSSSERTQKLHLVDYPTDNMGQEDSVQYFHACL